MIFIKYKTNHPYLTITGPNRGGAGLFSAGSDTFTPAWEFCKNESFDEHYRFLSQQFRCTDFIGLCKPKKRDCQNADTMVLWQDRQNTTKK